MATSHDKPQPLTATEELFAQAIRKTGLVYIADAREIAQGIWQDIWAYAESRYNDGYTAGVNAVQSRRSRQYDSSYSGSDCNYA